MTAQGAGRPLSLAHATLLHLPPPELVRIAAATGYGYVGLRLIPIDRPGEPRWTLAEHPRLLVDTRRALAETGVQVLDVEVVQVRSDDDPRAHLAAFEAAAELGARYILTNVYTPDPAAACDRFGALCDVLRPLGLTAALEFVSFADVRTLDEAVGVVARSGRDNAGLLVDALHVQAARTPTAALAVVPPGLVRYVHLCDGPREMPTAPDDLRRITREARLLPGEGGIDLAGILGALPRDVIVAVEVPNPARARALGDEPYARLAHEKAMACVASART